MEEFRKFISFFTGGVAFFTFIIFMTSDNHLSKWELVKTNLVYDNETSVLNKSQTPQYYILLNSSGSGDNETDYIVLLSQDCKIIRINQPNKKFYNQTIFSKKTYYLFDNGGVTKPEYFNGYIQHGEKAYTLEDFYENPPFEGDTDPLGPKSHHIFGWVSLGLVAICLIGFIPFEDYEFNLPNELKERKVKKTAIEIFPHLEYIFKVEKLKVIDFSIENTDWRINIDHDYRTVSINRLDHRDGISYDYKTKEVSLYNKYNLQTALKFIKLKSKLYPLYNGILDYVVTTVVDEVPPSDKIRIDV